MYIYFPDKKFRMLAMTTLPFNPKKIWLGNIHSILTFHITVIKLALVNLTPKTLR